MEMFQNEVINIQELKQYTNPLNEDIARLERELKLITSEIKEKDVLEKELAKTISTVDDVLNNDDIELLLFPKSYFLPIYAVVKIAVINAVNMTSIIPL